MRSVSEVAEAGQWGSGEAGKQTMKTLRHRPEGFFVCSFFPASPLSRFPAYIGQAAGLDGARISSG